MSETYEQSAGHRIETVTVTTNGVVADVTVMEYDILGNLVQEGSGDSPAVIPLTNVVYEEVSSIWFRISSGSVVSNGVTNALATVRRQMTGLSPGLHQQVAIVETNGESIVGTVALADYIRTVTQNNLALDTIEIRSYLSGYLVSAAESFGSQMLFEYAYDSANQIVLLPPPEPQAGFSLFASVPWGWGYMENTQHFQELRRRLERQLKALCPKISVKLDNKRGCCNPDDCTKEAESMSSAYISALQQARAARTVPGGFYGNVLIMLQEGAAAGEMYPEDLTPGLVCGGWFSLAQATLYPTTKNSNCWTFSTGQADGLITLIFKQTPAHTWGVLESVGGSISLDPWPSGGWEY